MKNSNVCSMIRKHRRLMNKFSAMFLIVISIGAMTNIATGQAIYTDKVDYMPGDVVTLKGYAWRPGEVVTVVLTENYLNPQGVVLATKSFTCDPFGKFSGILHNVVEANLGAFFHAKATGSVTNHVCTTVFHDAGGDYSIDYSAYDPEYYQRKTVAGFPSGYFPLEGNVVSPLGSGGTEGYTMHTHTIESLNPQFLGLGQIVAFEFYISADAGGACTNDKISFGGQWSTVTQNGGNFGFDPAYRVISAFVDPSSELQYQDGGTKASARILTNTLNGNNIDATFEVSGLDPGDKFPVEVWLVLKSSIASSVGSNVPTGTINGLTLGTCETGEEVKMGKQTIPLLQAGDFYTTDVDVSILKADSQDPAIIGSSFFYTLTVSNSGPSVANNIVITDVLNSNLGVDPEAITFSHDISAGYADDASWSHSFDITTHTLALTKLSMDIGETIYVRIPVSWISPYNGSKTPGTAGTGGPGSTCTGDLINRVSVTTISNDTNTANNSYCQPTNVYCSDVTANAGPDKVLTCTVTSVTLDGSGLPQGSIFSWVAGNSGHIVSGANTANPVVDAAGTYTLTVTDPLSGCSASDFAIVTLNNTPPIAEAGEAKVLTCTVTSILLGGSSSTVGATYQWSGPGIVTGGTTLTPSVNMEGTYILTVTAPNGCTATDNVSVALDNALPNVDAGEAKVLTCSVTSVLLGGSSSTAGATYQWSGPGIVSGATTLTPSVNMAGTYILTVTAPNGCTATDNVNVTLDNTLPNVDAGEAKVLTCTVTSVLLGGSSSTAGATYQWSGPGIITGGTTLTPSVNMAGTYILTVTAPNGCTATDNVLVTLDNALPNVEAGEAKVLTCTVTSIMLGGSSSTAGATYQWSGPGIVSGATTLTPSVNMAGNYVLTVTAPNGCTATDNVNVTLDNALPNVDAGEAKVLTCSVTSVLLAGSSSTADATYQWSGPGIVSGGTTLTPSVNMAGTYILTVTAPNGCTATDNVLVTLDNALPNVEAGEAKVLTCTVTSIMLGGSSSTAGATYQWSGPGIVSGGTTLTPSVNMAGNYVLTVTAPNGCTSTDNVNVTLDNALPNVDAGEAKVLTCSVTSVILSGSSSTIGATYQWSGPGIVSGGTTLTPSVNMAGNYVLTVTAPNGCTATDNVNVTLDNALPNVDAGEAKVLTCSVTSVILSGSSSTAGATYQWSEPGVVSGGTTLTPSVNMAGNYVLTVTAPNGCTATDNVNVSLNNTLPDVNAGPDKSETCTVNSVVLNGSSSTQGVTFNWVASNGGHIVTGSNSTAPTVDASGTYTLTVTDPSNGCTAIDFAVVNLGRDTEPPVIDCPASIMVSCASEVPDPVLPSAKDNCGLAKVEWIGDVISNMTCENKYTVTRTYRATDVNGLTADCKQLITVFDDKAPVLTIPADFNGLRGPDCSWNITPSVTGMATAKDNCDKLAEVTYKDEFVLLTECRKIIKRTWMAVDKCGNLATAVQTINYTEETPPVLVIPPDYKGIRGANCEYDNRPVITGQATATDNCDKSVDITYTDLLVVGTECSKVIERTWKAVDNCGNTATGVQKLYYTEVTPPVLVVPPDYNGIRGPECEYDTRPEITGQAKASDNCDKAVEINYTDELILGTECKKIINRTWKAVDNCGNTASGLQKLSFTEATPPVLEIPADFNGFVDAGCKYNSDPSLTGMAKATDNCDNSVDISYSDNVVSGAGCQKTIYRTWKAVDNCGNTTTAVQTITFRDDIKPVILPENGKTEYSIPACDTQFRLPMPSVSDNCDNDVILKAYVNGVEIDLTTYKFEKEGLTTVTFMAEDNCGNVATVLINVTRNPCQIGNLQYGDSKDMNEIKFRVYPNPFRDLAKFEICLPYDSRVRIDIFTYNGTLVSTILDEDLAKGEVRIVEFDASRYPQTTFVYRITTGMTWYNGTLIRSR